MPTNIADGDGYTPIQAGRVLGKGRAAETDAEREAREAEMADQWAKRRASRDGVRNVRSDNATVGYQADEINGDVTVTW